MQRILAGATLALLLLAMPVSALANDPKPIQVHYGFGTGLDANTPQTFVSGKTVLLPGASPGPWGSFNAQGAELTGITRVCIGGFAGRCHDGNLRIRVDDGSSFAFRLPGTASGRIEAEHAFVMFQDFSGDRDLNDLGLEKTAIAATAGARVTYSDLTPVSGNAMDEDTSGVVVALRTDSVVSVYRGTQFVDSMQGTNQAILFAGSPVMAPFTAEIAVVPFAIGSASFAPASKEAAKGNLDIDRIQRIGDILDEANQDNTNAKPADDNLARAQEVLEPILNGALMHVPGDGDDKKDFALIRFTELKVVAQGGALNWQGEGRFELRDGHVQHAKSLVGFWLLKFPWWGLVLYVIAIGLSVANVVMKRPKQNPRWEKLKWIGWAVTPVVLFFILWLWDREVHATLGVSILNSGLSGKARALVLVLEIVPLVLLSAGVVTPIKMLLKSGVRMGGQGRFMNLAGPVAYILGFLFGAGYLLSYLDLLAGQVMDKIG